MVRLLKKAIDELRSRGTRSLLRRVSGHLEMRLMGFLARWQGHVHIDGVVIAARARQMSDGLLLALLRGSYESEERTLLAEYLGSDQPVVELGAGVGVISCIVNRRLGPGIRHVVVEADPHSIPLLRRNKHANSCSFDIVQAAIAYDAAEVDFFIHPQLFINSSLQGTGEPVRVPSTSLERVAGAAGLHTFNLICDIEGSEAELIDRELDYLLEHVGTIVLEAHGHAAHLVLDRLGGNGFILKARTERVFCYTNPSLEIDPAGP